VARTSQKTPRKKASGSKLSAGMKKAAGRITKRGGGKKAEATPKKGSGRASKAKQMAPRCAICAAVMDASFREYPFVVCRECDATAVNSDGERPWTAQDETTTRTENGVFVIEDGGDGGENPVFINGAKCWRRYKFGGWITMKDPFDCRSLEDFYQRARSLEKTS